jgi:hypothetical protein
LKCTATPTPIPAAKSSIPASAAYGACGNAPGAADDIGRKTARIVSLNGATFDEAKADYARLQTERAADRLRPLGLTPTLTDYLEVHTQRMVVSGTNGQTAYQVTSAQ